MNFKFAATSLIAMALFVGPLHAQEEQPAGEQPAAEQPAVEAPAVEAPAALPEEIVALVNDRRTSQELGDDELKQRAGMARKFAKTRGLPDDVRGQLQAIVDSDRAELEARAQAAKPAEQPVEEKKAEPVQEAAPQPEEAPKPVAEIPQEITDLLNDGRALEELSPDELRARAKFARQQSRNDALPEDVRGKLAAIGKEARQALVAREKPTEEKKVEEPAPQPEPQQAEEPAPKVEEPPKQEAAPAEQPAAPVVEEPKAAETAPPPPEPAPVVDKVEAKELDGNAGNPEAEAKALAFLNDSASAESLSDEALRTRLDGMRDLMAENELSVKTERALRKKLREERDVLRDRVAKVKAEEEMKVAAAKAAEEAKQAQAAADAGQQPAPQKRKKPKFNINVIINADTPMREVLADRRDAEEMEESELRYRVRAWRDFERSKDFSGWDEEEVTNWRQRNQRDRQFLRRRMDEERNIRRVELEKPANIRRIVIEDEGQFDDDIPEDIFAAEVEDADIEKAILAPPRRKIVRKIKVEEIAAQPRAREALTRIEVDTIRFGFNEAFVREEEVDNLDQLASVIERVLKKYPREVFLIEGHTDAVGSDAYNVKLSKARAEAVKKALTTFYIIPQKNLKTVGLGERYLKIPTAEAEGENRRVSISRATALVGEVED